MDCMTCPICAGDGAFYRNVTGNINVPLDRSVYELYRCAVCSHVWRTNLLDKDIYDERYYAYTASRNDLFDSIKLFFARQDNFFGKPIWKGIEGWTRYQNCPLVKNGRVLDVGGGDGFVLDLYKSVGNKTCNTEILDFVVEASRKRGHLTYKSFDLSEITGAKFDLIRMNQVLEHVRQDPKILIKNCHRLLRRGGKMIIGIPNINSLSFLLYGSKFDQLSFPDHVHFFSEISLKVLLKDFERISITYPIHKYTCATNFFHICAHRFSVFDNKLLGLVFLIFSFPIGLLESLFRRTHFITCICVKG